MKSVKTLLIAGAVTGLMLGGSSAAFSQGIQDPGLDVRNCARDLAYRMRSCAAGYEDGVQPKDYVSKKSETAQGEPAEWSCGLDALYAYFECADGFGQGRVNDKVSVPLKRTNVKASTTPKND